MQAKISKDVILKSSDIIKGFVTKNQNASILRNVSPWQMIPEEEKTEEWIMWNADYFEAIGMSQVNQKYRRIIKNRRVASGILDLEDYIPNNGEFSHLTKFILPEEESVDILKQFFPLAPPLMNVMHGEFLKRDNAIQVYCTDRFTMSEKLEYKKGKVDEILLKRALSQKEETLKQAGIQYTPEDQLKNASQEQVQQVQEMNKQFYSEMDAVKDLQDTERKFKDYRHIMELFGQHVLNKDKQRFAMDELESEAFLENLTNAEEYWHIDLGENDYKAELLDNANCFKHKSHNIKYVSEGDYFGWFTDMSVGDVINSLGEKLKDTDYKQLEDIMKQSIGMTGQDGIFLTDSQKGFPGAYYDSSKPFPLGRTNIPMNEAIVEESLKSQFSNFQNYSADTLLGQMGKRNSIFGEPKMFRVMRLYFRSQRKIGLLTRKLKDGSLQEPSWVDECYKVTEKPIYDNTISKDNTKENLVYGEHIDWEWRNQWRRLIKINNNTAHSFWKNYAYGFKPIYLQGDPVPFQFKGKDNNLECYPPVEGCEFRKKQVKAVSFLEHIKPHQVLFNIAKNKVTSIMGDDIGLALVVNRNTMIKSNPGIEASRDPIEAAMDRLRDTKVVDISLDRELLKDLGGQVSPYPQILNLSRIQEAAQYNQLANSFVEDAFQVVGISRPRSVQAKPGETSATEAQLGVNFSETSTEVYFHQHSVELMPRVYQRMIEAAQYYCTINESARVYYQTSNEENAYLEVENLEGLSRDYFVTATNNINIREMNRKLEGLLLSNNTTDLTGLDLMEGIAAQSVTEKLDKIRKAYVERTKKEEAKQQREYELEQRKIQSQEKQLKDKLDWDAQQAQLDRESEERIAVTRALGGIQTDVNENGATDAAENLKLQRDKIDNQNQQFQDKLSQDQQKHQDKQNLEREKNDQKMIIAQKQLAVALANSNKSTDKNMVKKIAKKQNVD